MKRRTFIGVGMGCAVPLLAGAGLVSKGGLLASGGAAREPRGAPDRIWDHIASEAWRTSQEAQGIMGARGEHVRRLASQLDLFAVSLDARSISHDLDDELSRRLREEGRESVAADIIQRHREFTGGRRASRGGFERQLDPAALADCLDRLNARGAVPSLRSKRGALERGAMRLDRDARDSGGQVRQVTAAGQKPGDDFLPPGYPDSPTSLGLCASLEFLMLEFAVLETLLTIMGIIPAAIAAGAVNNLCEVLWFMFCRKAE